MGLNPGGASSGHLAKNLAGALWPHAFQSITAASGQPLLGCTGTGLLSVRPVSWTVFLNWDLSGKTGSIGIIAEEDKYRCLL